LQAPSLSGSSNKRWGKVSSFLLTPHAMLNMRCKLKILAFDPYVKEVPSGLNVKLTGLEELLKDSDIITIHARLTPESYHLIGEKELN